MKTPRDYLFKGMMAWSVPMLLPILISFLNDKLYFNILMISLIYPLVLVNAAKSSSFRISRTPLAYAGIASLILSYVIITWSEKGKQALSNPKEHRTTAAFIYAGYYLLFFLIMFISGAYFEPLFVQSNFS